MMRDDENDAAALDDRLPDDDRRLLQRYFAAEQGSETDGLDLRGVADLLRRARGHGFIPPSEGSRG